MLKNGQIPKSLMVFSCCGIIFSRQEINFSHVEICNPTVEIYFPNVEVCNRPEMIRFSAGFLSSLTYWFTRKKLRM